MDLAPQSNRLEQFRAVLADSAVRLARHEWRALYGHSQALIERLAVARQAHGLGELLRDQLDLLPESRRRLRRNFETRREILRSLRSELLRLRRLP